MDKKKKISVVRLLAAIFLLMTAGTLKAQDDGAEVEFYGVRYSYDQGDDCVTLFLKTEHSQKELKDHLKVFENGEEIDEESYEIRKPEITSISDDYTFSVLIDQSISRRERKDIYRAVEDLVRSAPEGCVYLSFFGDEVSPSELVTAETLEDFKEAFEADCSHKYFYDAVLAKFAEFGNDQPEILEKARLARGYKSNKDIAKRAKKAENERQNVLIIFTEATRPADDNIIRTDVTEYQSTTRNVLPIVDAYYYTAGASVDPYVDAVLDVISRPREQGRDGSFHVVEKLKGDYKKSDSQEDILASFAETVDEARYDFEFVYTVPSDAQYAGKVTYTAEWEEEEVDEVHYQIGTKENPWPLRTEPTADFVLKYFMAFLITALMVFFFFLVMKLFVPLVKQKSFAVKYYKRYKPEQGVQKRTCNYCKQEIEPGQLIVARCKHIMHADCWKQNGYQCAEYGQNCKEGFQTHVDTQELFTMRSLRDCHLTTAGIIAGLVSWIVYELTGRGFFSSFSEAIVKLFITSEKQSNLIPICTTKVSAFLTIGLLLAFFLSIIFRYNDEYRKKDGMVYLKILSLSLVSAVIGMLAFAVGAVILCMMLSTAGTTYIPWYCSLPAYMLFSVCTALSLTIKSSIPIKSAMIGGLVSAVIGFLVLYFSSFTSALYGWMNMLLDFIIYGGGLGASLVTVRILAEKYYLVIKNGLKKGQRIPIHKWMSSTGGNNTVSIGIAGDCEVQMNWEKSGKVAKEHVQLYIDQGRGLPMMKPLATGVVYNSRAEMPSNRPAVLSNGDTFKIGDTIFQYVETD